MEGIGTILGIIALFVSLAALWFVNDVVKRIERQSQQLLESHLKALKEGLESCETGIKAVEKKTAEANRHMSDLSQKGKEFQEGISENRAIMEKLRADLDALDKSIPTSYRNSRSGRRGD